MFNNTTKSISWKDDIDFKYYLDTTSSDLYKIKSYKVEFKKNIISITFVHLMYSRVSRQEDWFQNYHIDRNINNYNSLEDFVHNRIFDSYYQANKMKLKLNPPLTYQQKQELAVSRLWSNINWSKNNLNNSWDDYKPINLL